MMYILSGDKKQIINSDFVERFCISEKPDAALIVASYDKNIQLVTVARYRDLREAQKVLGELLCAIAGGQAYYTMPESLLYAERRQLIMTDRELILLHDLLEDLETDEGVCYKTRSSTCATACPLWYAGAFGDNICLPSVLGHRVTRLIRDKQLREREKGGVTHGKD